MQRLRIGVGRAGEAEVVAALRGWLMARSQCLIDLRGLAEGALVLAALPSGSDAAAWIARTTTGENMCQGCEWSRIFTVTRSSPASFSSCSSLPNTFAE